MSNKTFNVSGCTSDACIVSDNGNATVNVGDWVQWNKTGSASSISITVKKGTDKDIWGDTPPAPYPNATSSNWRGTVQFVGDGGEDYSVGCTCGSNSSSHDPRITVATGGNR